MQYIGAIVRIRIRNFMTYTDTELRPGPNLNIILGPNGTGKSAIVCCIIVGLAGEVGLTGRGSSPADFVKKHQDSASTEIELFNDNGKNFVVERIIHITKRTKFKNEHVSDWKINGKKVLKNDVKALTKSLNIKVDNLCQFLPQDSVTQFVKMNSCELLLNTLKAAGDIKLVDDHKLLIDYTKDVEEKNNALRSLERSRKENEVNAKRLESEVVLLRQRQSLIKEKNLCLQKMAWLQYQEALDQRDSYRASVIQMHKDLKQAERNNEPCERALKLRQDLETKAKEILKESHIRVTKAKHRVEDLKEKLIAEKQACQLKFSEFKAKLDDEARRAENIKNRHQEINSLECKYEEYKEIDCSRQLAALDEEMGVVREARKQNLHDKRDAENNLRNIVNDLDKLVKEKDQIFRIKDKKLQLLQSRNRDAVRGLEWVNKNKDRFKKHVYSPIMCEIDIKDAANACIIENSIPKNELMSFVCQTKEDLQTFTRAARDELKIKVSVVMAPTKTMDQFTQESRISPQYLESIGIKAFLKDLITAPDPIMRYLCANHQFHRIPIAIDMSDARQFKELSEKFRKFYIGHQFYHVSNSKYDAEQVISSEKVREANLLQYSLDTIKLRECEAKHIELKKQHDEMTKKQEEVAIENLKLMKDWDELANRHREFSIKEEEKRRIETCTHRAREALKKLESERLDIEAERGKLAKDVQVINNSTMKVIDKLLTAFQIHINFRQEHMRSVIKTKLATRNFNVAKKKLVKAKGDCIRLTEEIKKSEGRLKTFTAAKNQYKKAAEEKVPGFIDGQLDSKTQARFNKIVENTVPQLKDKRDDLAVRINRICHDANNSILNEYTRQNEQLKDKAEQIADLTAALKALETRRLEIQRTWVPKLQEVIRVIDKNYQKFMQNLGYDGQVKLDFNTADPENFSSYGIQILVRYRDNDNLIPLSSTRQSGGERSVATMIYMLALQTKTTVPFRCVDEINQGMDKENERKVFELLIHTADSSSSQYFLVSPKLLNNLPYSDKMMVHVVFNGKNLRRGVWDNK